MMKLTKNKQEVVTKRFRVKWALLACALVAVVLVIWFIWPSGESASEKVCPGKSQSNSATKHFISRQDTIKDEISEQAFVELERLYYKDGKWIEDQESGFKWSETSAKAEASSVGAKATFEYRQLAKQHCVGGKWDSGWSENRIYDAALDKGESEIARLEKETPLVHASLVGMCA